MNARRQATARQGPTLVPKRGVCVATVGRTFRSDIEDCNFDWASAPEEVIFRSHTESLAHGARPWSFRPIYEKASSLSD